MKIGFVTTFDAREVGHWSGTPFFLAKALQAHGAKVEFIGPLKEKSVAVFKAKQAFTKFMRQSNYLRHREPIILRDYARQIEQRLKTSDCDLVLSPGSVPVAYLECRQPIAIWADATFARMVDYYENFSHLTEESTRNGHAAEQSALDRCRLAAYSSDWAAESAHRDYNVPQEKLSIIPFGANVPWHPAANEVEDMIRARPRNSCRLLFIGLQWQRKGGAMAMQIAQLLSRSSLSVELTLIGSRPKTRPLPPYVRSIDFIDKGNFEGQELLKTEIARAHFLLLPALADCSPAVLAEANSLGVPVLAANVGGIPTIVRDGLNGYLLPKDAAAEDYCARIAGCKNYSELARSAYNEFATRLNWQTATRELLNRLQP